jgi:AraC-like DNA-binding protein
MPSAAGVTGAASRLTPLTGPRSLPVGIKPVPGEALQSWLAALARQLDMQWGQFVEFILPPASVSEIHSVARVNFTAHLTTDDLDAISAATGIDTASIAALTWHRFDGTAGTVDAARRRMRMTWSFGRSRFCPVCLEHSGGRWQLEWRLPWVFACQKHSRLLADTCQACGQTQRTSHGWLSGHLVPTPERCSATAPTGERCAADLSATPTTTLGESHPFLKAQAVLSGLSPNTTLTSGLYQTWPASTAQFLTDLRLLALRAAEATDAQNLREIAQSHPSGELVAEWDSVDMRQWRASPNTPRTAPALIAAIGVSSALELLQCSTLDEAAPRLQPFLVMRRKAGKQVNTDALTTRNRNPIPDAVMLRALTETMSPSDQLRFRALTPLPRSPGKLPTEALRSIPTCLWGDWAIRILPPDRKNGRRRETTRAVLAILLAAVGNRAAEAEIAKCLGLGRFGPLWARNQASQLAALLYRHRLWTTIASALTRLADYLADQPSPIDYAQRRGLSYRKLLPDNEWEQIFEATDFGRLDCARTGQLIRTWLFQRISTLPPDMSPFTAGSTDPADYHRESIELLAPPIADHLDDIASRFLQQHNIVDEPLIWSPPLSLVADLELPGPDVDLLSIEHLHPAILKGPRSIDNAAKAMGVRPLVVRHLLERTPLPRPVCRGQQRPRKQTRLDRARLQLRRAELAHLYEQEKWTFFAIARHFGIDPKVVKQLAVEYGIHVIPAAARPPPVAAAWLHQEYVVNHRTLEDMAQETGISRPTLSKRAKELGIPVRRSTRHITAEWIYQQHVARQRLIKDLAQEAGVSPTALSRRAKELGIPVRRNPRFNPSLPITEEWIYQEYVLNRRTLTDMAQEAGVAYQTLSEWTKKLGIPVRRSPQSKATSPIAKEWMYREYVLNQRTLTDMAQEAGVKYQTLSTKAKQWGIPVQHGGRRPTNRRGTARTEVAVRTD